VSASLELREVVKHFRAGEIVRAVDRVSLRIDPGEMVALYGPSGSGKTTLLLMAGAYLRPDTGAVLFDGQDVTGLTTRERAIYQRREVGLVQQTFYLTPGASAVDNAVVKLLADRVALAEARKRVVPWLERVGLGARLGHTPAQLSGGEQQRVALARALVNEPGLILADEPTAYLDRRRGAEMVRLLCDIAHDRDVAVLLVTHDPDAALVADRVYTLSDGLLIEDPPPRAPLASTTASQRSD
jgi:putative ABC transport system ATP-binding protein